MYITVNNTKLFFDVYGSKLKINSNSVLEKPTLIVLHGGHGFADHTLYVEFWSQFSEIAQVIFLDQRGCGRSTRNIASEWNLEQWANDLDQFCKQVDIHRPIIAGVSMGGHVMGEIVRKFRDLPGGLIFCNTEAKFDLDQVINKAKNLGGKLAAESCREFFSNPNNMTFKNYVDHCIPFYAKNAYTKIELDRCIKQPEVFFHYCRNQMLNFNYLDDLYKITCPTLLLVGDESLHTVESAQEMAEKIKPDLLTMKIFTDAGAPVYKDKPEETLLAVKEFLLSFI